MNSKITLVFLVALGALVVGLAGGYWYATSESDDAILISLDSARQPLFYRNPMNPEVTSPIPAKDQMGMDYIPVYADANANAGSPTGTVSIDPVTVQNIGVRTAVAQVRTIAREINTLGRVDYDEQRITRLHPKTQGWIEALRIGTTGEAIEDDEILLSIYSPQLVSSQQEYLLALKSFETLRDSPFQDVSRGAADLVDTSLERLRLLDVPEHQIAALKESGEVSRVLHIHSPAEGIVVNVGVRDGQFVTPQSELYMIADLSAVWVFVDIFEEELPWVRVGDEAEMRVTAVPGTTLRGKLTYIYPYAESATRTIKARLEFDNRDLLLKPDMFADVTIFADPRQNVVVVPSEAIVRSGLQEQVFVVREPGKFEPRKVEIGLSGNGVTEIRSGLSSGDEVVVSAQFLIDSESKLRESAAKMMELEND
jgi:Cu(I)/Ag(I) efflux system membrane fusion protein